MGNAQPAPAGAPVIVLRVTVRADDLESFVNRYSRHLHGDRIFIFTKNPQPVGTRVKFTLQLQSGEQLLHGKGTVTRVQEDKGDKRHPPGMELVFVALDDRSQTLVDFMLATRAEEAPPIVRAVVPPPKVAKPPPMPAPPKAPPPAPPAEVAAKPAAEAEPADAPTEPPTNVDSAPPISLLIPPPQQDPDPVEPAALDRPSSIAIKLAENVPPAASEPVAPGPAPQFAEKWRDPLPPGAPAAGTDHTVSANPFTEVPDSAIDYFVEWSLEQSIGPRSEPTSSFSDVAMSLPGVPVGDDGSPAARSKTRRLLMMVGGAAFGAGALLGVGLTLALHSPSPVVTRAAMVPAPAPVAAAPAPAAEAPKAAAPEPAEPAAAEGELVVNTRPPGANVTVDGKPAGVTPATLKIAPGAHAVSVSKERYATTETSVNAPGQITLDLKRPATTLRVVSSPAGAEVTVAGVARGRTPASLRLPAYESYDVQVAMAGAKPWRKSVYLKAAGNQVLATLVSAKPAKPAAKGR